MYNVVEPPNKPKPPFFISALFESQYPLPLTPWQFWFYSNVFEESLKDKIAEADERLIKFQLRFESYFMHRFRFLPFYEGTEKSALFYLARGEKYLAKVEENLAQARGSFSEYQEREKFGSKMYKTQTPFITEKREYVKKTQKNIFIQLDNVQSAFDRLKNRLKLLKEDSDL